MGLIDPGAILVCLFVSTDCSSAMPVTALAAPHPSSMLAAKRGCNARAPHCFRTIAVSTLMLCANRAVFGIAQSSTGTAVRQIRCQSSMYMTLFFS